MTQDPHHPPGGTETPPGAHRSPTLAENLLLLLFQPDAGLRSGTGAIAGENTLFYTLAGAVLADLTLGDHVQTETSWGTTRVEAVAHRPPADTILRSAWEYLSPKPRAVQTVLATIGPKLRGPLLDRLVERGDIHRTHRKMLGLFKTEALEDGGTGRRDRLVADVRAVLVDGAPARPRVAALAALLSGSGTLPQFDPEIPWTSPVIARAKEFEQGNWGAGAAADAVALTMAAAIATTVVTATVPRP
ncbi:GOLPH3/VPS74 family protein [Micromonospora sp. SH-82]|uniref:GOLPH3/VPS74 family protein n=1 Tax=Micromonospora sp. SH-82 TaxID=3132938 RepID=UPI003EB7D2B3